MSDNTRDTLNEIAAQMYAKAAEAHVRGMSWASQSARVSQFALVGSDEEVKHFLRLLLKDGLVDMVDGQPVVQETGEPEARIDIRITSGGGES